MDSVASHWTKRLRTRVQREVALRVTHLPGPVVSAIGQRKRVTLDGRTLDPQLAAILQLEQIRGVVDLTRYEVAVARRKMVRSLMLLDLAPEGGVDVRSLRVAGATGSLPARYYAPFGLPTGSPLIVFFHGGGMVTCGLDTHDALCRRLVKRIGARLVSVDYRMAPEHPFPAAPEDAVAAFRDLATRAAELGADPARVAVMGDSAGGNLSAVVSNRTRGEKLQPALQVLIYPAVELTGSFPSYKTFADGFFLTKKLCDWFMDHYLGSQNRSVPDASPIVCEDVRGVAPALIYTAGFDPLRDEGLAYSEKLAAAGVRVKYREHRSLVHGYAQMAGAVDAARAAVDEMAADVQEALHA